MTPAPFKQGNKLRFELQRFRKAVLVLLLIGIYFLGVTYRRSICRYQVARQESRLFTGESALVYHYAQLVARGIDLPVNDLRVQYPGGLRIRESISVGVELLSGRLYRFFGFSGIDFSLFIRWFTPVFFSIGIFPVFLIGSMVFRDKMAGLVSAIFYAVSLPSVVRSTGLELSRENFALPLIFFHIYFFLKCLDISVSRKDRQGNFQFWRNSAAVLFSGLFLAAALSTWEGTQVYFYFFTLFAVVRILIIRENFRFYFGWFFVFGIVFFAGLLVPYLRAHYFLRSYPALVSFALIPAAGFRVFIRKWSGAGAEAEVSFPDVRARNISVAIFFIFFLLTLYFHGHGYHETYSHFRSLLFYKLRFLMEKPLDPGLLPFEVRMMWTPALLRPGFAGIFAHFTVLLIPGAFAFVILLRRMFTGRASGRERFLFWGGIYFFSLYLLFSRIEVFFVFFLTVLIGEIFIFLKGKRPW